MAKISKTYRFDESLIKKIEELSVMLTKYMGTDISNTDVIRIAVNDMYGEVISNKLGNDILERDRNFLDE